MITASRLYRYHPTALLHCPRKKYRVTIKPDGYQALQKIGKHQNVQTQNESLTLSIPITTYTNPPTTTLITHPPNLKTPAILIRRRATHTHHIPRLKHRRPHPVHHLATVAGEERDLGDLLPLRTVFDADVGGAADGTPFVAVFGRQDVVSGAEVDVAGGAGPVHWAFWKASIQPLRARGERRLVGGGVWGVVVFVVGRERAVVC